MSTSFPIPLPSSEGLTSVGTLGELANRFGDLPLTRICFSPLPGLATGEDLLRLRAEQGKRFELVDGTLIEKAMGAYEGLLASWLVTQLHIYLTTNPIGIAFGDGTPLQLAPKLIRLPDCGFIALDRLPGGEFPIDSPTPHIVPNLAVEVVSVTNTRGEMEAKMAEYFGHGVQEVWYLYPRTRQLFQFTPGTQFRVIEIDESITTELLPGFSLSMKCLFSPPGRPKL
ncbi:hypothetical protein ETAA8_38600 [Anatilimnocola aggregata]|uniref:Putative restriction endonuclease domain-containing protein n=1 Tax=Anatilimnocola aggregata TaxID=2528021 RepID=A0A517YET9_9BACT|nr:Uma2 family endonuclease [Anatilimnocola aggregata]QDU28755.1 hypothetical protein ETAA8_38600 [Anatilimnocola aggregata]